MKTLVIGTTGFVGEQVREAFSADHEVHGAARNPKPESGDHYVDLSQPETIEALLEKIRPDVIVQCAGIVENNDAVEQNPTFTKNLLEAVTKSGTHPTRVILLGSAAEYGEVEGDESPIDEKTPLRATSHYGRSKIKETEIALDFHKQGLPVVVARIFNPLGRHMQPRFLTSRVLQQIEEVRQGNRQAIEVSRLDAKRDYLHVRDVAQGIKAIAEGQPLEVIYNIGSGKATTNAELIKLMLEKSNLKVSPVVTETSPTPEPLFAAQADISKMQRDFNWEPTTPLTQIVDELTHATDR